MGTKGGMAPISGWLVNSRLQRLLRDREWGPAAVTLAAICYAWVISGTNPFTWQARLLTILPFAVLVLVAVRGAPTWARSRIRRRWTTAWRGPLRLGLALWLAWLVVAAGWELASFFQHPRAMHPTASSLMNDMLGSREGKAVGATLWLMVGWEIVRR